MLQAQEIPTAPGRLPLLGHSHRITGDPREFVLSLARLGPIVRVYLGPQASYLLTTPDLIRDVSLGRAGDFHRDTLREAISELVSGATNVLSGPEHDLRRRMIAPVFRQGPLTSYAQTVASIADEWSASLVAGACPDIRPHVHELVMRTMFATLFQADSDAADDHINFIRTHIPWLLSEVIIRGSLPAPLRRLRVLSNRRFTSQSKQVRAAMRALVEQSRLGTDRPDMASTLLSHVDEDSGATLDDDDVIDELLLALAAGIGSQSSTFSWLIYEIVRAPAIASRVYEELDSVIGTGPIQPAQASSLPFLRKVLMETLRVWAQWITLLTADGPVRIGPTAFPDGTNIVFSPYLVHHQDRYFPDAQTFDPDRWDDDVDRQAMMPFGVGQRHCPGNNFALLSITLAAAALFSRWRPQLPGDFRLKVVGRDFVLSPVRLPLLLTPAG